MRSDNLLVYLTPRRECTSQVHESICVSVCVGVCTCACVCLPAVWGSSSCQLTSCIWRSKAARAVKNGAQHGQSMWACSVYCAPPPPPSSSPSLSLWRVHLFVSQQNCCLHSQHSTKIPKLKLRMKQRKRGERVLCFCCIHKWFL